MSYTLGVDIGTFESKGVLVDGDGRIVTSAARPHKLLVPQAGWAEHRAEEDWWGDFVYITKELLRTSGIAADRIAAVATSAIGPCMLPVDDDGRPLMNGVLYGVDTRAAREIDELTASIGAATILARCGNALTSQSVGPKILWLARNRPDLFAKTAKILTSTSYVTFRLTGAYVIDHYTAASFSPFYDVGRLDWAFDMAPGIIGPDHLPRLMWSTGIAGHVTAAAAAETGLAVGTPVTCGTIDAAAEAISVGLRDPGDMMMMYGSTIFIIQRTEARVADARLWYAPWLFPGEHASMAGLATSGTLTHWFRDQFARDLPAETAFATLAAEAAASPKAAKGLLVLPYFSGERTPIHDPKAKGAIFGLDLTHERGDLYRATLEGIAHGTAHVIDTFREIGQPPARILAVGGGTKNAVWLQATSDIGRIGQILSGITLGASYGDAFLAAVATGRVERSDISRWNPPTHEVAATDAEAYVAAHTQFQRLYAQTRDIAHALGETR
ncbi:MAG: carbohydrate kinase [Rhodobacterales bacterium 32-67-9]|nr:MAG: carbohydrate kinase [Rhodobacterales bacterium 32-67-9]